MIITTPGHGYELENFEPSTVANTITPTLELAHQVCDAIEKLAASEEATNLSVMASQLSSAVQSMIYGNQTLHFIQTGPVPGGAAGEIKTVRNGTTNEEVLAVLIDRINYLQSKFPCRENAIALTHTETALLWLNKRTADRKARGVEGKALK